MQSVLDRTASRQRTISLGRDYGGELIAVPVPDDSMLDPSNPRTSIMRGDDAVIDMALAIKPGQIALIYDPDSREHCIRRAKFLSRSLIRFLAATDDYPAIDLPAESPHILGVVRAIQRALI